MLKRYISYRDASGRKEEIKVSYNRQHKLWFSFNVLIDQSKPNFMLKTFFGYSKEGVKSGQRVKGTVEINFDVLQMKWNMKSSGRFVQAMDNENIVFVCHNGRLGGGKKNISREGFFKFLEENSDFEILPVYTSKNKESKMVIIGALNSEALFESIAKFVKKASDYKASVGLINKVR